MGDGGHGRCRATDDVADRVRMLRFHGSRDKQTSSSTSASTRGSTRCRRRSCACSCRERRRLERGPRAPAADRYAALGLGELVELPRRRGARATSTTSTSCARAERDALAAAVQGRRDRRRRLLRARRSTCSPCSRTSATARASLPETERAAREGLALPMFPTLAEQQQREVVAAVRAAAPAAALAGADARLDRPHQLAARPVFAPLIRAHAGARRDVRGHRPRRSRRRSSCSSCTASTTRSSATTAAARGPARRGPRAAAWPRCSGSAAAARFDAAHRPRLDRPADGLPRRCASRNTTMFDYEYATLQHSLNCRLAHRVLVPDAIPPAALRAFGARPAKLVRYPGLKEEYSLADFEPDPAVPRGARARRRGASASCCARRPTSRSTTGSRTRCSTSVLRAPRRARRRRAVVLPRTPGAGASGSARLALPSAARARARRRRRRACVAGADLVVSAGGTMNREAVVLGTPVYTDVRRPPGRRRRAADRGGPAAAAARRRRAGPRAQVGRSPPSACGATPTR